jgi:hypothetical protein
MPEGSKHNLKFQSAMWPQAFSARGSRLMIVVRQLEAVKI